jgi:L-fucono-1,5-lactonase
MKIDAHQHFWRYDAQRDSWITDDMRAIRRDFLPADLQRVIEANGFDGCVAVQADQSEAETQFLLDLARRHPFIKGVVGWVDLRAEPRELEATLERLAADPRLRGVRHVAQAEPDDFLTRGEVVRGIGCLARASLAYDILIYAHQLPAAIALASRLPDQRFVLDHLAKPPIKSGALEPWAASLGELARRPNVWCKLSGLVTETDWADWRPGQLRPYLDVALEAFGPGRVMFGSDWPVCLVAGSYERVLGVVADYAASLSKTERAALFGGNAARFYGLT